MKNIPEEMTDVNIWSVQTIFEVEDCLLQVDDSREKIAMALKYFIDESTTPVATNWRNSQVDKIKSIATWKIYPKK